MLLQLQILVRKAFIAPIRLYQLFISPVLPKSCRYTPTCSEYMAQAIDKFGVCAGIAKGIWRIMRCNPFGGWGYDPVEKNPEEEHARRA